MQKSDYFREDFVYKNVKISFVLGNILDIPGEILVNLTDQYLSLDVKKGFAPETRLRAGRKYISELKEFIDKKTQKSKNVREKVKIPCGEIVNTDAHDLKTYRLIFNVVGPIYNEKNAKEGIKRLKRCIIGLLEESFKAHAKSITFPLNLAFDFPGTLSAEIMIDNLLTIFKEKEEGSLKEILFVDLEKKNLEFLKNTFLQKIGGKHIYKQKANNENAQEKPKTALEMEKNIKETLEIKNLNEKPNILMKNTEKEQLEKQLKEDLNIKEKPSDSNKNGDKEKLELEKPSPQLKNHEKSMSPQNKSNKKHENEKTQENDNPNEKKPQINEINSIPAKKQSPNQIKATFDYKNHKISIVHGDITQETSDAIVNAANNELWLGGGVAGAILKAAGKEIQKECNDITYKKGNLYNGDTAITSSYKLKEKQGIQYVIHAVGPVWEGGHHEEPQNLRDCVKNSLSKYHDKNIKCISFPAISSGIFGFPKELCAEIMLKTTLTMIDKNEVKIKEIRFTNFDLPTVKIFEEKLAEIRKQFDNNKKGYMDEDKNKVKDTLIFHGTRICLIEGKVFDETSEALIIRYRPKDIASKDDIIIQELKGLIDNGEIVMRTGPGIYGNQGIKHIFHMNFEDVNKDLIKKSADKVWLQIKENNVQKFSVDLESKEGFYFEIYLKSLLEFIVENEGGFKEIRFVESKEEKMDELIIVLENYKKMGHLIKKKGMKMKKEDSSCNVEITEEMKE